MKLVLDASVAIAWAVEDEHHAYAELAQKALDTDRAIVPTLWFWEIANTLLVLERKGRLHDASIACRNLLMAIAIEVQSDTPDRSRSLAVIEVARKYALSVYDSAYLTLAISTGTPLATLDKKLAKAAAAEGVLFGKDC